MGIFKTPSESSYDACEDMLRLSLFYGFVNDRFLLLSVLGF